MSRITRIVRRFHPTRTLYTLGILAVSGAIILGSATGLASHREAREDLVPIRIVVNDEFRPEITGPGGSAQVNGRVSLSVLVETDDLHRGLALVEGLNVMYWDVPREAMGLAAGQDPDLVLGFKADPNLTQSLKVREGALVGRVAGYVSSSSAPGNGQGVQDSSHESGTSPVQPAVVEISIHLEEPLPAVSARLTDRVAVHADSMDIRLRAADATLVGLPPHWFVYEWDLTRLVIANAFVFGVMPEICIKPVSIQGTGAGLEFGMPKIEEQWGYKAGVLVQVAAWELLTADSPYEVLPYFIMKESDMDELREELHETVNDPLCVEMFFTHAFDPEDAWGSGITFNLGGVNAQIISSDGNARGDEDFNHLAHELGHVMGLCHPDDNGCPASLVRASEGTLMCRSGYLNDNPENNSQVNIDGLSSPLFQYRLALPSDGVHPDCEDSDCGECEEL
jgi:hypothetical protein